ncbi:MAG TPA: FAD-dependent monooxygenase [Polyangia bacterium]|nr:FAD-dependent monooxygenase [Polyangia bacterium]
MSGPTPHERATDVLIVGAGPTGLVLALWLSRMGVRVRIVDQTAGPGTTSRALVVQARTLELYRPFGLADQVQSRGLRVEAVNLWARGEKRGRAEFGPAGNGLSPYPYAIIFPQDEHEQLLIGELARRGITVERNTRLVSFDAGMGGVVAHLQTGDAPPTVCRAAYLAGCDGAHSTVRTAIGADFPGGTYDHLFYVADVTAQGPVMDGELHLDLDEADFVFAFPLAADGRARLIGTIHGAGEGDAQLGWDDVSPDVLRRMRIDVQQVNWFSTYHVHHRVASFFRTGRVFLLGDAAHIHSPVGGQGMNTGIGDAVNLAWKLAGVLGGADPSLLDTYEPERIGFARRLVATTDRAFQLATSRSAAARPIRRSVVPALLPRLFARPEMRRLMFRIVSQMQIAYRHSTLSEGHAHGVHAGDRLPWVAGDPDNFAPLNGTDWQAHVYGHAEPDVARACSARGIDVHPMRWTPEAGEAGFVDGGLYLIRPDGYLGLVDPKANIERLARYWDQRVGAPVREISPALLRR